MKNKLIEMTVKNYPKMYWGQILKSIIKNQLSASVRGIFIKSNLQSKIIYSSNFRWDLKDYFQNDRLARANKVRQRSGIWRN